MIQIHPIFTTIISLFICLISVFQSIQKEKMLKGRLIFSILLTIISAMTIIFYQSHIENNVSYQPYYLYYVMLVFITLFIFLALIFYQTILKVNQHQLFVKSMKQSKWNAYYLVDHKERIIDISQPFLDELGFEKEEVIGKKLFDIFNKAIRFTQLNQNDINNRQLEYIYQEYRKNHRKDDVLHQELSFLNYQGETIFLHLVIQPVYTFNKYKGRMAIGEKRTDFDLLSVEKVLKVTNESLDSIQNKFISTLEITKEGIYFIDLDDKSIWLSDSLVAFLQLPHNQMNLTDFRRLIEPQDLQKQLQKIAELTKQNSVYQTKLRVYIDGQYQWFQDRGKRIFDDKTAMITGTMNPIITSHFQASGIDVLDELKDQNELIVHIESLIQKARYFQLIIIHLKSIPEINTLHGRAIGNMMMAKYIKDMKDNFLSEGGGMFRLTGLEFALTITDPRKMSLIKQWLQGQKDFLNRTEEIGSIRALMDVYMGGVTSSDGNSALDLFEKANQALKVALNEKFEGNACYYKDIL